ncbi:MAG TPA: L-threonylcarbamoyladenylate synthase [Blastocatellia bacterium]|nr:L-threonylcarbamoyladenylate synthase [Blastocatellia bacterium]
MTLVLKLDADHPQPELIAKAASIIQAGGLVAFPTETVYGLGADAMNERAVQRIFEAKGRPADNPLIVHICDRAMLDLVAEDVSAKAEALIAAFWPGPLTLVLRRDPRVAESVSAGLATVAVRIPNTRIASELIRRAATPIAAPSANRSGRPSPTTAAHVATDLDGRIDMILDGGKTKIGIESTVLDMTSEPPVILRPGWVTREQLTNAIGQVGHAASIEELKRSPGTRHMHYSPRARVLLVELKSPASILRKCTDLLREGKVGFIGHTSVPISEPGFSTIFLENSAEAYARSIYSAFRELDERGVDVIVVEGISDEDEGAAVMDRLRRAASSFDRE